MSEMHGPEPKAGEALRKSRYALMGSLLLVSSATLSCGDGAAGGPSAVPGNGVGGSVDPSTATGGTDPGVGGSGGTSVGTGISIVDEGTGGFTVSGTDFSECSAARTEAEGIGLDMFVVLDHTSSMGSDCPLDLASSPPATSSKWCLASHALAKYFTSESAAGHRAALQYMSLETSVCEGGVDNGQAYAAVPLTLLPSPVDGPLVASLSNEAPSADFGTQIEAALRGIASYTTANRDPIRPMIGILITDGDPSRCDTDVDNLAAIAQAHLGATELKTFIIGMTGATLTNLETMAISGGAPEHGPEFCGRGTSSCHYWSVGDGDPIAFVNALEQIQQAAILPCEFQVPAAPEGDTLRYDLVNVEYVDATDVSTPLGYVESAALCTGLSWYYDNQLAPTKIGLCPDSCAAVSNSLLGARVNIRYGCATVPQAS